MFAAIAAADLNKFDPIKGIETSRISTSQSSATSRFKQIWPDQGDWNILYLNFTQLTYLKFKQIWPDQGDWNALLPFFEAEISYLNKFDPIKGIET